MTIQQDKKKLVKEFFKIAKDEGFNKKALKQALITCDFKESYDEIFFPNGLNEIMEYFVKDIDKKMSNDVQKSNVEKMKIRERIKFIILTRLKILRKNKESLKKILPYFALPQNSLTLLSLNASSVNLMWRLAGDTSTDFNYYTKRLLLSAVYTSTILFWLNDKSKNEKETEKFLSKRIEDVLKIEKLKGKAKEALTKFST